MTMTRFLIVYRELNDRVLSLLRPEGVEKSLSPSLLQAAPQPLACRQLVESTPMMQGPQ